jgi:hypothetical protein
MSVLGWSTTAVASRYTHVITPIHSNLASRLHGLLWSSRDAPIGTGDRLNRSALLRLPGRQSRVGG